MFRQRRMWVATVLVALSLATMSAPLAAHPYGPPPTAEVSAEGSSVRVAWRAAADDAAVIGVAVGLLDPSVVESYLEGPAQAAPPEADEIALARSDELRMYLLEHIAVAQDGTDCDGTVEETARFVTEGAQVVFDCPEPVEAVEVRISMLHDVHPAYRTFADSPQETDPAQAVFTAADPVQRWDFSQGAGTGAMGMDRFEERLVAVFDAGLSGWSGVAALGIACGLGAGHAIGPGHGEAVLGAFLAATRGRVRDAAGVGVLVAAMHTLSALLVGATLFAFASSGAATGTLTTWLMLAAGGLVAILGGTMLRSHRHHHADRLPPGVSPLSRRGVVVLGVSGGLIPSPASFLVLATGLVAGRAGTALLLVGAFSVGMAATLTAVGAGVVGGRVLVERRGETSTRFAGVLRVLPVAGALGVTLGGVVLVVAAVSRLLR